ncbi:hypothetical protein Bca4012_096090 [Brassica carinata]
MAFCSPTNPHFFQPLLPGFTKHLDIPVAFFLKHLDKSNKGKTAKLRSDASETTWNVKLDGRRFSDGWEYFAVAHDLRVGDIVVFRHEGELVFYVTALGPSCCEIQYGEEDSQEEDKSDFTVDTEEVPKKKRQDIEADSSFVAIVTASNIRRDTMLPLEFTKGNGIKNAEKIKMIDRYGTTWSTSLLMDKKKRGAMKLGKGCIRFCEVNGVKMGESFVLELVWEDTVPVLKFCSKC